MSSQLQTRLYAGRAVRTVQVQELEARLIRPAPALEAQAAAPLGVLPPSETDGAVPAREPDGAVPPAAG